ncbi:MAG: nuclear transport factor 2 family protein [Calditrichota bacterium]
MSTMDIANKMVALCKEGKNVEAIETLFADDVVSVEATAAPGMDQTATGKEAVMGKNQWWLSAHEVHSSNITGPWPHGDRFIVGFEMDVTVKESGQRMQMAEAALYTVEDGKIVKEEFFYNMG